MLTALQTVKAYPLQTEVGLNKYYPGFDIGQWHRGEMSSRKLLTLISGFDSESWFWASVRADKEKYDEQEQLRPALEAQQRNVSELYAKVPKHLWPKDRKAVRSGGDPHRRRS